MRDRQHVRVSMHGGRMYSELENHIAISVIRGLQLGCPELESRSELDAIKIAAFLLQRSVRNLQLLLTRYRFRGAVALQRAKTTRGMAHPTQQSKVFQFTTSMDAAIRALIVNRAVASKMTSTRHILAELKEKFGGQPGYVRLYQHMRSLKLPYGTVKRGPLNFGDQSIRIRERVFLIQFDRELRRERAGDTVIVYSDESFLHQSHCGRRSYYDPTSVMGRRVASGSKGKRLIVLHAMTRSGLVATRTASGSYLHSPDTPIAATGDPITTTELVYEGADREDYHSTMDADMYERWVSKQLIPSLMVLFPGKRIVLVIDGAGYHRAVPKELAVRKHKTKRDYIDYLERLGVIDPPHTLTLTVVRAGALHSIPIANVNANAPVGPYVAELALMVRAYKRALPPVNVSRASELFDAWSAAEHRTSANDRHAVLYTPPGGMEEQPIEKLWAKTKNAVAAQYYQRRSITDTRKQLMTAFDACDATFCDKLVEHAQKEMNGMIRFQPLLKGTIGALEYDITTSNADVVQYVHQFMLNPPPKRHRKQADDSGESSSSSDDEPASASQSQPRLPPPPPAPSASLPPLPSLAVSLSQLGVARSSRSASSSAV